MAVTDLRGWKVRVSETARVKSNGIRRRSKRGVLYELCAEQENFVKDELRLDWEIQLFDHNLIVLGNFKLHHA
jgi:hypothetical protein